MSLDVQPVINVADVSLDALSHGERFAVRTGEIGAALGLSTLGCMLHVVPPGKRAFTLSRASPNRYSPSPERITNISSQP